eukprot:COSAG01_NODE_751_length_13837_cov_78.727981_1_plen_557_part_00
MQPLAMLVALQRLALTTSSWTAESGPARVTVDRQTFDYSVSVAGSPWLGGGQVALQCGGQRYSSTGKWVERNSRREYQAGNLTGGEIAVANGTDPTLGAYSAIQRHWTAGTCMALITSIRQYTGGGIEFVTEVSAQGARGTVTEPGAKPVVAGNKPVTEFPSFTLPNVQPPPPPAPPPPPPHYPPSPPPGPPAKVGCSDGTCEGLCSHPSVRGCGAHWDGVKSLRAKPTGKPCGSAPTHPACASPTDACGPGWGVCLSHSAAGLDTPSFLKAIDANTCGTPKGAFVAGMSHAPGTACPHPANHSVDNGCKASGYGGEPLCCGDKCAVPSCSSALWPEKTPVLFGAEGAGCCAAVTIRADHQPRGVLCCKTAAGDDDDDDRVEGPGRHAKIGEAGVETPGLITWTGNSLRGIFKHLPQGSNLGAWSGGLEGGPIVLYSAAAEAAGSSQGSTTTAMVLGPSSMFKVGLMSRVGNRLVAGAQGMITELPPHYTLRFALVGRSDGISSSMMAFGQLLQKSHGTATTKLSLSDDPLSRQLHFVDDGKLRDCRSLGSKLLLK